MNTNVLTGNERGIFADTTSKSMVSAPAVADETAGSAVSWAAVLGGAVVAAALSLILIALGSGLGLMSVSPWSRSGVSAEVISVGSVVWLCAMQLISAAVGGYVAGRLRTRWINVHTDEVYFRDTAHGLLVWAVGVVISATLLTSAAAGLLGITGRAVGAMTGGATQAAGSAMREMLGSAPAPASASPVDDFVDLLMRSDKPTSEESRDSGQRAEFGRLLASSLRQGSLSPDSRTYLASQIAARTGLTQDAAEQRVDNVFAQARQTGAQAEEGARKAADAARRTAASFSLWLFVSLLIGAFSASWAATVGGRQRDHIQPHM